MIFTLPPTVNLYYMVTSYNYSILYLSPIINMNYVSVFYICSILYAHMLPVMCIMNSRLLFVICIKCLHITIHLYCRPTTKNSPVVYVHLIQFIYVIFLPSTIHLYYTPRVLAVICIIDPRSTRHLYFRLSFHTLHLYQRFW